MATYLKVTYYSVIDKSLYPNPNEFPNHVNALKELYDIPNEKPPFFAVSVEFIPLREEYIYEFDPIHMECRSTKNGTETELMYCNIIDVELLADGDVPPYFMEIYEKLVEYGKKFNSKAVLRGKNEVEERRIKAFYYEAKDDSKKFVV